MNQTAFTVRMDSELKKQFSSLCENLGLPVSVAINLFAKTAVRENRIPFEIAQTPDPFFTEPNLSHVKKAVQELRAGKGTAHELIEVDDE